MAGITGWLLVGVLLLPLTGAVLARLAGRWWGQSATRLIGGGGFAGAIICLLLLQRAPLDQAALGRLAIFLPSGNVVVSPDALVQLPTIVPTTLSTPSQTPTPAPTTPATATPTALPTATPIPTATPTAVPSPTEAPPPPTDAPPPTEVPPPPPTEAPRPAQARRYIVESGDTLRGIASRFGVSVEAILRYNGLSAEEGDSLSVGQEIFIPPRP